MSAITVKRKEVKFMVIAVNWHEKKDNSGKYCHSKISILLGTKVEIEGGMFKD